MLVKPEDSDEEIEMLNENVAGVVTRCFEQASENGKQIAEALQFKNLPHVLYFDPKKKRLNGQDARPILINMHDRN